MHQALLRLDLVKHLTKNTNERIDIFTLDIDPSGTRLVTFGNDNMLKVWKVEALLDGKEDETLLCSTEIDECINRVRWSPDGKYFATGDVKSNVKLWRLNQPMGYANSAFNNESKNVENWKCMVTFRGHTNDVSGLAWSPDSHLLASCCIDNSILVWDIESKYSEISLAMVVSTYLATLQGHSGWVRDLSWDPVGRYLASFSDDKSVIIWRCTDWKLETRIKGPFEKSSSLSVLCRQLSWSPDGAFICASHCFEPPRNVALVLERNMWNNTENAVRLVGHEAPIQLCAFSPTLYERTSPDGETIQSAVVAIACQKGTLSLWTPSRNRPIIVCKNLCASQLLDMRWSWDGTKLFVSSTNGIVVCLNCDYFRDHPNLGVPMSRSSLQDVLRSRFGEIHSTNTEGVLIEGPEVIRMQNNVKISNSGFSQESNSLNTNLNGSGAPTNLAPRPVVNRLQARRKGDPVPQPTIQPVQNTTAPPSQATPHVVDDVAKHGLKNVVKVDFSGTPPKVLHPAKIPSVYTRCLWRSADHTIIAKVRREQKKSMPGASEQWETRVAISEDTRPLWNAVLTGKVVAVAGNKSFCAVATTSNEVHLYGEAGLMLLPAIQLPGPVASLSASEGDTPFLAIVLCTGRMRIWNVRLLCCECSDAFIDPLFVQEDPKKVFHMTNANALEDLMESYAKEAIFEDADDQPGGDDGNTDDGNTVTNLMLTQKGTAVLTLIRPKIGKEWTPYTFGEECAAFAFFQQMQSWVRISDPRQFLASEFYSTLSMSDTHNSQSQMHNNLIRLGQRAQLASTSSGATARMFWEYGSDFTNTGNASKEHLESLMSVSNILGSVDEYKKWLKLYAKKIADDADIPRATALCQSFLGPCGVSASSDQDSAIRAIQKEMGITEAPEQLKLWDPVLFGKESKHGMLVDIILPAMLNRKELQTICVEYNHALSEVGSQHISMAAESTENGAAAAIPLTKKQRLEDRMT